MSKFKRFAGPAALIRPITKLVAGIPTTTFVGLAAKGGVKIKLAASTWWAGDATTPNADLRMGSIAYTASLQTNGRITQAQVDAVTEPLAQQPSSFLFNNVPLWVIAFNTKEQIMFANAALTQMAGINAGTGTQVFDPMTYTMIPKEGSTVATDASMFARTHGVAFPGWADTYTSPFATTVLTSNNTTPADGITVTVDGIVFTAKTTLTGVPGQVHIGGSANAFLLNLSRAINGLGTPGTDYIAPAYQPNVSASLAVTAYSITFTSLLFLLDGNAITVSTTDAVTLSFLAPGGSTTTLGGATGVFTAAGAYSMSDAISANYKLKWVDNTSTAIPGFGDAATPNFRGQKGVKVALGMQTAPVPDDALGIGNMLIQSFTASATFIPWDGPTPDQMEDNLYHQGAGAGIGMPITKDGYDLSITGPTGALKIDLLRAGLVSSGLDYSTGLVRQDEARWDAGQGIAAGVSLNPVTVAIAS